MNIFNFGFDGKGEAFEYVFDITPCFTSDQMVDFRIAFPVDYTKASVENKRDLVLQVRDNIQSYGDVSPLRVQNVIVSICPEFSVAGK